MLNSYAVVRTGDAGRILPRKSRRTRRMEFDELKVNGVKRFVL